MRVSPRTVGHSKQTPVGRLFSASYPDFRLPFQRGTRGSEVSSKYITQASLMTAGDDIPTTQEFSAIEGEEGYDFSTMTYPSHLVLSSRAIDSDVSLCFVATKSELPPQNELLLPYTTSDPQSATCADIVKCSPSAIEKRDQSITIILTDPFHKNIGVHNALNTRIMMLYRPCTTPRSLHCLSVPSRLVQSFFDTLAHCICCFGDSRRPGIDP